MQTFDQALLHHYQGGRVSMEEALKAATHPHDFRLLVASEGKRHTSVESVLDDVNGEPAASGVPGEPSA
jgi:twitching motility protein PilT